MHVCLCVSVCMSVHMHMHVGVCVWIMGSYGGTSSILIMGKCKQWTMDWTGPCTGLD